MLHLRQEGREGRERGEGGGERGGRGREGWEGGVGKEGRVRRGVIRILYSRTGFTSLYAYKLTIS